MRLASSRVRARGGRLQTTFAILSASTRRTRHMVQNGPLIRRPRTLEEETFHDPDRVGNSYREATLAAVARHLPLLDVRGTALDG